MTTVTTDNLQTIVTESTKPVFVDLYAEWCGPCKMISPIVDELAKEYGDKIEFVKLNVDENPVSAAAFGVRSIPTLLVFDKGELVKRHSGAIPKIKIVELFQNFLI
jgi:thioredoxin 1